MKRNLKLTVTICLICLFANNQAQVKFGPKVGMNISDFKSKNMNFQSLTGFHIGGIVEIEISEAFSFQSGILYSTKGAVDNLNFNNKEIERKFAPNYLEIPFNAMYKYNIGKVAVLGFAGPYTAYAIAGKADRIGVSIETGDVKKTEEDIKFGSNDEETYPNDFGLNFGVGMEVKNIQLTLQYGLGFINLINYDGSELKNRVLGFSVAYMFGKK